MNVLIMKTKNYNFLRNLSNNTTFYALFTKKSNYSKIVSPILE